MNLSTRYLNLDLKNPIIVASSGLTKSVDKMLQCEQAGAGAVVMKSLFEEALGKEEWGLEQGTALHTEAYEYLRAELQMQYGPRDYCATIEKAKKRLSIPVIASINCVSARWWPSYAVQMEQAGADAIELNVFPLYGSPLATGGETEKLYYDILAAVKSKVKIPVAMKISSNFSALANIAAGLGQKGLNGLVLFNRFTDFDINIKKMQVMTTFHFSHEDEYHVPLRWIALLAGRVKSDLAATTGIHSAETVIKMLLAGARAVQLASLLYQNGLESIKKIIKDMEAWMQESGFSSLDQFIGHCSQESTATPELYLRTQFMEKIRGWE
ncbi:dihydroorotate dehydrogenase-like protein [candidate division KSB1 bacterium]|nr:dihydroorotate dehydrogenase-like protein [candidate division KSB1 bacterium]